MSAGTVRPPACVHSAAVPSAVCMGSESSGVSVPPLANCLWRPRAPPPPSRALTTCPPWAFPTALLPPVSSMVQVGAGIVSGSQFADLSVFVYVQPRCPPANGRRLLLSRALLGPPLVRHVVGWSESSRRRGARGCGEGHHLRDRTGQSGRRGARQAWGTLGLQTPDSTLELTGHWKFSCYSRSFWNAPMTWGTV